MSVEVPRRPPERPDAPFTAGRRRASHREGHRSRQLGPGRTAWLVFGVIVLGLLTSGPSPVGSALDAVNRAIAEATRPVRGRLSEAAADALSPLGWRGTSLALRWGAIAFLLATRQWRRLVAFVASVVLVGALLSFVPFKGSLDLLMGAAGTLVGIAFATIPRGRWRSLAVCGAGVLVAAAVLARVTGTPVVPSDLLLGSLLAGIATAVVFWLFAPDDTFPVRYRSRIAAHLDLDDARPEAIRRAMREQLGFEIDAVEPFGLDASAGSSPLRMRVAGNPDGYLFGKLYTSQHLRADRWYKLGRSILYGELEDETPFKSVRQLVEYEDYCLRVMRDAGLAIPRPYGFVEVTPRREYLLVTEFVRAGEPLTERSELGDETIDDGLATARLLRKGGIAHRDIKPANLLVVDGRLCLVDVAFAEVRPSRWRQSVDLADMMLVLALGSDPARVYERALRLFTPTDIAEAFATAHGPAVPRQLRTLVQRDPRDLLGEFRRLAPPHDPLPVQHWSARRVLRSFGVLLTGLAACFLVFVSLEGIGLW